MIKANELKEKLDKGEAIRLVDVRSAEAFAKGDSIPGSENIPADNFLEEAAMGKISKDQKIVVFCQGGKSCSMVAEKLHGEGYNIEHIEGGLNAYNAENMMQSQAS